MFAYVKYGAKCPHHEERKIVPVSEIRNFDSQNIGNRNKSYNIKCGKFYCAAIIIFTDETEKGLKEKIETKRQSLPPQDLTESASDLDNPVSSAATKQAARQKNGDQVKKLLEKKLDALENKIPRKTNNFQAVSDKHTNNILQDRTNNVPKERQVVKRKNPGLSSNGIESANSQKSAQKSAPKSVESTSKKSKPNSSEKSDSAISRSTADPGKSCTIKTSNQKTGDETPKNAPVRTTESSNAKVVQLLSGEMNKLKEKCSKYEEKVMEQKAMIKDLTQLNIELQRDIIEYFADFKVMAKQYEGAVRNLEGADTPPTGYQQKSTNKIHLGRNIWIDRKVYENTLSAAKTNQLFVKSMAVAVFGYNVLESSSVSGTKCNKFKDRPAKPRLDGTKILAIRVNPDVVDDERDGSKELDSVVDGGEVVYDEANDLEESNDSTNNTLDKVHVELDEDDETSDDLVPNSVDRNVHQLTNVNESELDDDQVEEHKDFANSDVHTDEENENNKENKKCEGNAVDVEVVGGKDNESTEGDE